MTASHREQILEKLMQLITDADIAGSQVARSRTIPVARAEGPTFLVWWKSDVPLIPSVGVGNNTTPIDWSLSIEVHVICRGEIPDQVADPFVVALHSALCADVRLAGLSQAVTPGEVEAEFFDADNDAVDVTVPFVIRYRTTSYADLTS